jgi:F-type H+-transporting ATPase subunit gamma
MPSLKAIRRRIASVTSTQQITRAMKLVAAARLRQAQEALLDARPYGEALTRLADSLLEFERTASAPAEGAKHESLLLVISSDRGLCGGYNTNLLRAADQVRTKTESDGVKVRLFAVGRKAVDHYKRARVAIAGSRIDNFPRLASIGLARDLAAMMLTTYRAGEVRETGIVYMRFQSALTQKPTFERLLPVAPPEERRGRADQRPTEYLIEPSREALVPLVIRSYLESAVFHALLEAEASEQGSKMTAMDNATKSAGDMIETLTREMNRARQAQITRELMDIVGGAEALRGEA